MLRAHLWLQLRRQMDGRGAISCPVRRGQGPQALCSPLRHLDGSVVADCGAAPSSARVGACRVAEPIGGTPGRDMEATGAARNAWALMLPLPAGSLLLLQLCLL